MSHTETHVKPLTTSQQSRAWAGPAIFSYGFRPFFLFGAAWAAGAMVLWMLMLSGVLMLPTRFDPVLWHAHEFLYGYIGAIIAGFLLTAVPNWTGRLPVVGWALAGLFALWVTGRVAVATSALWPAGIVAGIDLSFLTVLGGVILREIVAGKNWRNLVILALLALFALSNLRFHMEAAGSGIAAGGYGQRLGVSTVIMMIAVIGGRVIPSFTRNWLVQQKSVHLPVPPMRGFDKITLGVTLPALGLWVVLPDHRITGAALVVIGVLHFIRVVRWQGWQTLSEPLLLVLHLAYIFVPAGAVAIGLSQLWPDAVSVAAGQHLWMAGAGGLMTLAMMTRATLGHTGQTLRAGSGTVAIYLALIGSTIARVCAGFMFGSAMVFYSLSALLWVFAFAGFAVLYGPYLMRPKPAHA